MKTFDSKGVRELKLEISTLDQAQFLANALNRPQVVISYEESGETKFCIAQMVSRNRPGDIWVFPSKNPQTRKKAKEEYDRTNVIPS